MSLDRLELLAMVHIAQKDLRLSDEVYRAELERLTGKTSASDLGDDELARVVEAFKARGWVPLVTSEHAHVRAFYSAWRALVKIASAKPAAVRRVIMHALANVDDPEQLTPEQAEVATNTLKHWTDRIRAEAKPRKRRSKESSCP